MLTIYELKRIIFGWMVDFLCWDGLNDFLLTSSSESMMRTQDLLNGCLSSPVLMDNVPYRRSAANLIRFVLKICNGNNSTVNDKCQITILETAIEQLQQLKQEIPDLTEKVKELEVQLRIHAVIVCCHSGNFILAREVYDRLDLESLLHSELTTEKDKILLQDLQGILSNEDVNHELLRAYSYNSFILTWVPVIQDIFDNTREPHLVEMCRGMIGNKLIAIEAKSNKFESTSDSSSEYPLSPEIKSDSVSTSHSTFVEKMEKALNCLNIERDLSLAFKRQKPKLLSKLSADKKHKLLGKIQKRLQTFAVLDAVKRLVPADGSCTDSLDLDENKVSNIDYHTPTQTSSNSPEIPSTFLRECRVVCIPLEYDTNIPLSLRTSCLRQRSDASQDTLNTRIKAIVPDSPMGMELEKIEQSPSERSDNDYYGVEAAVAKLFNEELPENIKSNEGKTVEAEEEFQTSTSNYQANKSDTFYECTPTSHMPTLDLNMGDIWSKQTSLTPFPPHRPTINLRKKRLKLPWTVEEEEKLYAGVQLYNEGNWERIRWQFQLTHRSSTNLSDKWRNLKGNSTRMKILKKLYLKQLAVDANMSPLENSPLF